MKRPICTDPFTYNQPEKVFVEELKKPVHTEKPSYFGKRGAEEGEVALNGIYVIAEFVDENLVTAYNDFQVFLNVYEIAGKHYPIITQKGETSVFEEYKIITDSEKTILISNDTEGIRRGLIYIEDEMRRREGAFLPIGETVRTPHMRSRITHCFFAPINRPPNFEEELGDDVDYYPDEYLNRLAHDGSNGVWIYTIFKDLLPSKIIPEYGIDGKRRLDKLNRTIQKCKRYGIKVFAFAIEPDGFSTEEMKKKYSDILGTEGFDRTAFCTASERGKAYCKEAFETLFTYCPDLAGALIITNGERVTNCSSNYADIKKHINTCPNCKDKTAPEILAQAIDAMREGMRGVNPNAEYLSWSYGHRGWEYEDIEEFIRLAPNDCCIVQGLEDNGISVQLGKERMAIDYWLSYAGPSEMFKRTAVAAKKYGKDLYAKTQVCCSHEVATVPYVPAPGLLFDKYKAMFELGVKGVVQCWYFGNYPSLMNKAAGEFAFLHDYSDKRKFLTDLAAIYWGRKKAEKVVDAWEMFEKGYKNYPLNVMFNYYGPMHDGPVWLLQLIPKNFALPRTWQGGDPVDGDRINESFLSGHTIEEIHTLTQIMHKYWREGTKILSSIDAEIGDEVEQVSVANALDCQFESGMNIVEFYMLRDALGLEQGDLKETLARMEKIVRREIEISKTLSEISEADKRLGYHSEAEGYKYFPEKLLHRANYLEELLKTEFCEVSKRLEDGIYPFDYYKGIEEGAVRYKLGSGFSDFVDGGAQLSVTEDDNNLIVEFRSKTVEGITISTEFNLFKFDVPVFISTDGEPYLPWRVWMYCGLSPEDREKEIDKYKVEKLLPTEEYPGTHLKVYIDKKKAGWTGGPMKMAIQTNLNDDRSRAYWSHTEKVIPRLGKGYMHYDTYVWLDR